MAEYRIGDVVTVPCVRTAWAKVVPVAWRPVAGDVHYCGDLQPYIPMHYHVDARFIDSRSRGLMVTRHDGPRQRVNFLVINFAWPVDLGRPIMLEALLRGRGMDSSWCRLLPRRVLAKWPSPFIPTLQVLERLEAKYAAASVVNERCPHWGFDLTTVPQDADGHRVCPLHGLRWGSDGRLAPYTAEMAAIGRASEAYEVERRLREGPVDPEFHDWAKRELAGRLRGPRTPLPPVDIAGLDEQDLVTDEETAPVPPLPPTQALAKARRALDEVEAEAERFRDAVAFEEARMATDRGSPHWGRTLRPWDREWHTLLRMWELEQRNLDFIVADTRTLVKAAFSNAQNTATTPG